MQFEDVYQYVGHLGVYQICILMVACMLSMFDSEAVTMVFVGGNMDHWCRVDELAELKYSVQQSIAIPYIDGVYSSCQMYDCNYTLMDDVGSLQENCTRERVVDCTRWIYEQTTFVSTIVSRVTKFIV